jgi:hypothetical protein
MKSRASTVDGYGYSRSALPLQKFPDSTSHHLPLMAYRPMVFSATRTHRVEENISSTPIFPSFRKPVHSPQAHPCRATASTSTSIFLSISLPVPTLRPLVTKAPSPVSTQRILRKRFILQFLKWHLHRHSESSKSPGLLAPAPPLLWGQVLPFCVTSNLGPMTIKDIDSFDHAPLDWDKFEQDVVPPSPSHRVTTLTLTSPTVPALVNIPENDVEGEKGKSS